MRRGGAIGVAAIALACAGCGPESIPDLRRELLTSWGLDFLVPAYGEAAGRVQALAGDLDLLCGAPSTGALGRARDAWWRARGPWKTAETFALGPYTLEPLRLGPKIDFWPARPETIDGLVRSTSPIDAIALAGLGATVRGYPVIEYLLWKPDTDVVAELAAEPRRCALLRALAADLAVNLETLAHAWDPAEGGYLLELTEPPAGMTLHEAFGEVVNRFGFTVENARTDKLGKPLGETAGATDTDAVESRFSGRSIVDIDDALAGIEVLYFGAAEVRGLSEYLRFRGVDLDAGMREVAGRARAALAAADQPLAEALLRDPTSVRASIDTLGELQRFLQIQVLGQLSVSVGFNDNDGD